MQLTSDMAKVIDTRGVMTHFDRFFLVGGQELVKLG